MVELPAGTVTFLFTDIEGSTKLTQELGDVWPPLLERHNAILREAIEANGGMRVGSEGDSVFAVFTSAPRGVAAAVQAQQALHAEPWPGEVNVRVRMGLHTGEGVVSGDSYVGLDVHRAARIAAAGHGGQVLLSAATRTLADSHLPEGVSVQELGEHRLKDLSRPERICMLLIPGLPSDFPPLRSLDEVPNNLPTQLTTFLGRNRELRDAAVLLAGTRLLTLTGPGGTGKTRLALQLAAESTGRFLDGVYFVPLGPITEGSLVMSAVAQAVGVDPGKAPIDRLADHLAGRRLLLVLDNFEQVLDAAPSIGELLTRLPNLTVLATSRSPLHIYGEQEFPVPPLDLPNPHRLPDHESLSQYASVALFVERAMAVRPGFAVDASNAPAIAEICVRLDGLPLAIELAAARVRVLSPQAILGRLGDRLSLLAGGSRNLPERQQTLRGAIDWSFELLEQPERIAFARFSVFAGGADVDAVEKVVVADWPAGAGPVPDALDALESLVDKSLLAQDVTEDGGVRFRMLETIRDYAAERLREREPDDVTRLRHAEHYLALADDAASRLFGAEQRTCLDTLEREHDNLRVAIGFAIATERGELAMRLLVAIWRFWHMRGHLEEGRDKAERILALPGLADHPDLHMRALEAAGGIAYWQGDIVAARAWYQAQREVARQLGDRAAEAESLYNESMSISYEFEDFRGSRTLAEEALEIFRELGNRHGEGRALWAIVTGSLLFEGSPEAMGASEEAVRIFRELDDRFLLGWALYTHALALTQARDLSAAREHLDEALAIFRDTGDLSGYSLVLDGFAAIEWLAGDRDRAMRIAGAAASLQDVSGVGLARRNREVTNFFPQDLLSEAPLAEAYAAGQSLSAEEAIELALERHEEPVQS